MMDALTSEPSDINISSSVNATTAETVTANLAGRASIAIPIFVRVAILLFVAICNLGGNGFTVITIRLTPRLWTKTNFIIASMMVADIINGVVMLWYSPFIVVVYVFNNPCHYNVVITALTPFMKLGGYVSIYHLVLVSIERYIAIVYPLHYETKFTDRTLKWAIFTAWATGILVSLSYALWLINADLRKCNLIPTHYDLVDVVVVYIPVCISMFICYGKILAISWRQRHRIETINVKQAAGTSIQTTAVTTESQAQTKADNTHDPKEKPLSSTGSPAKPAMRNGAASSSAELSMQQRQKSRRREFKAVYLTAAIVGSFVILWIPHIMARVLGSAGYNPVIVSKLHMGAGTIGAFNFAFTWIIYAAVSKSYRRAYRQMLIRIGCCCCKTLTLQADN